MWELRTVAAAPPDESPDPAAVVGPGGTGELLARGPGTAEGYLGNPAAEEALFVDGWLRTNDVARASPGNGYLPIVDRVDNMVVSGGENVYPQEVEQVFEDYDAVREAVVFSRTDEE